jgi:hypothetical protein
MKILGVELNDSAITAVCEQDVVFAEPGYAIDHNGGAVFGWQARKFSRLFPRRLDNRFWQILEETPLSRPVGPHSSSADLVQAQLQRLWLAAGSRADGVVFAVPGRWSDEQLGLLLGIAQDLQLPVRGLVDSAVAATRHEYRGGDLIHLDIALHEVTVTRISQAGQAGVGERVVIDSFGIERLERVCIELIARQFVEATRFDPLHEAESEQYLYDHLYDWCARLGRQGAVSLTVPFGGNEFSTDINLNVFKQRLTRVCEPVTQRIRGLLSVGRTTALQCHSRWTDFPGLLNVLQQLPNVEVFALEPAAAARGAMQRLVHIADDSTGGFRLVSSLPWDKPPVVLADVAAQKTADVMTGQVPTHVLYDSIAYRLDGPAFHIGAELADGDYGVRLQGQVRGISRRHCSIHREGGRVVVTDHSRFGTALNGHNVDGSAVCQSGDVLSLGDPVSEFRLITEVNDVGA